MIKPKGRYAAIAGLALVLSVLSCVRRFAIQPQGSIADLTFKFYELNTRKQKDFSIQDLLIQEEAGSDKWVVIWELNGKAALDHIKYGEKPASLAETTAPHPLSATETYRVVVNLQHAGAGISAACFGFDEKGMAREVKCP